jgi:hypothetical protein
VLACSTRASTVASRSRLAVELTTRAASTSARCDWIRRAVRTADLQLLRAGPARLRPDRAQDADQLVVGDQRRGELRADLPQPGALGQEGRRELGPEVDLPDHLAGREPPQLLGARPPGRDRAGAERGGEGGYAGAAEEHAVAEALGQVDADAAAVEQQLGLPGHGLEQGWQLVAGRGRHGLHRLGEGTHVHGPDDTSVRGGVA